MTPIGPGATVGIFGGGQLARMLALEGRRMTLRIAVLDPEPGGPAGQVADLHIEGALDDVAAVEELARHSDVLTIDTEHVPADLIARVEETRPVRPSAHVLRIVQDRLEQRRFLAAEGAPQVRYAPVDDPESLSVAALAVGLPAVLKTRRAGYDGRGQARIDRAADLDGAWRAIGQAPAVLERFVDFEREISVLLARSIDGHTSVFPITENEHRRHILRTSRAPARVSAGLATEAQRLAARIAAALGHVGMLAVELFVTRDEALLVNELAPRPHNSGHYTFGACATSQFEQHLRAICGLPLGEPSLLRPCAMLNLLGELWHDGEPDWSPVFAHPSARLHLYGKRRASPGRKMGHVLVLGEDIERASAIVEAIDAGLRMPAPRKQGA